MTENYSFLARFKWFESFSEALAAIPDRSARAEFALKIVEYGSFGIEPNFGEEWWYECAFAPIRKVLDISVARNIAADKGGRPKKQRKPEAFNLEQVDAMAAAAEVCQEPIPDDVLEAQAAYMSDEYERRLDEMRAEIEASEWVY